MAFVWCRRFGVRWENWLRCGKKKPTARAASPSVAHFPSFAPQLSHAFRGTSDLSMKLLSTSASEIRGKLMCIPLDGMAALRWISSSREPTIRYAPRNDGSKMPRMKDFQSINEMAQMVYRRIDKMRPRDLGAFWTQTSQMIRDQNGRNHGGDHHMHGQQQELMDHLKSILLRTMSDIKSFGSRDLAQTAHALAKIAKEVGSGRRDPGVTHQTLRDLLIGQNSHQVTTIFQMIANEAALDLSRFEARHLANLTYANAIIRSVPMLKSGRTSSAQDAETTQNNNLFDGIANHIVEHANLRKFNPQELSNTVWAFANAEEAHPQLFQKLGDHIASLNDLDRFNAQNLSNTVLAFAKAKESHPELFQKVGDHIAALDNLASLNDLDNFKPQALSNTVWAFATVEESHPHMFLKVADHIAALNDLGKFNPQNLSNTVLAFAKTKESHPHLFRKVGDHIVALNDLGRFNAQDFSNTVWAFATAKESHPQLFRKVGDHIAALNKLDSFHPQALSNTVWAFATAEESHTRLFRKVGDHIAALDNLDKFNEQDLTITVWAFAAAKQPHPRMFKKVADHILALETLQGFIAYNCAQLLWAYATVDIFHSPLFKKVHVHVQENIDFAALDVRGQKNLLWAYEKAEHARKKQQ